MVAKYNDCAAALTWEILNEVQDIGNWEIKFENKEQITGKGFEEFLNAVAKFDNTTVIYVKRLRWFLYIGSNFINYADYQANADYFASVGNGNKLNFFYFKMEHVELREWNNFFQKIEDTDKFLELIGNIRQYFKGKSATKMGLARGLRTTISHDLWEDLGYKYFIGAGNNKIINERLMPQSIEEFDLYKRYNKGGLTFVNEEHINKVVKDVHCYDLKSSYLGSFVRRKYPQSTFEKCDDVEKISRIIKNDDYAWIGEFYLKNLRYKTKVLKVNLISGKNPWAVKDQADNDYWVVVLNNVDMIWFKEMFEWDESRFSSFFYSKADYNCYNYINMANEVFEEKEQSAAGSNAKIIRKLRTELIYGQSIKALSYSGQVYYDEETNQFCGFNEYGMEEELTIDEIQSKLSKRKMPFQYGLWTAAWSRVELIQTILAIGEENFIYGDTDSVYFTGFEGIKVIEERNREIKRTVERMKSKRCVYVNPLLGTWKNEGDAKKFRVLGLKWYAKVDEAGEFKVKASGANPKAIEKELKKKKNPIAYFNKFMEVEGMMTAIEPSSTVPGAIKVNSIKKLDTEFLKDLYRATYGTNIYYFEEEE